MSYQLARCSKCGKIPLNGFVGDLCYSCWFDKAPRSRQEKLD